MNQSKAIEPEYGTGKKNIKSYVIGLLLCIILTLIPFHIVMQRTLAHSTILWVLLISALLQFWVQAKCFLRLNSKTVQGNYNVLSFVFAIVVVGVLVVGSMWIMYHLNFNMMH